MRYLVAYDVGIDQKGSNRLKKVANICEAYGQRIQYSLFEVRLSEKEITTLKVKLEKVINKNLDQIRIMKIEENDDKNILLGILKNYTLDDPLIF